MNVKSVLCHTFIFFMGGLLGRGATSEPGDIRNRKRSAQTGPPVLPNEPGRVLRLCDLTSDRLRYRVRFSIH